MATDTNLSPWLWEQGGQQWGMDPRMDVSSDTAIVQWEKDAINALSTSEKNTIVTAHLWKCVRKQRNDLLVECDWTQGADVPNAIKSAWTSYRQALRDVTTQSDPDNITWPSKPS